MLTLTILLVILVGYSECKTFVKNQDVVCPDPMPVPKPNFEEAKFLGQWYEATGTYGEPGTDCDRIDYEPVMGSVWISIENVAVLPDGRFSQACGWMTANEKPGQYIAYFPEVPKKPYIILDTDYDNWAAGYSCSTDDDLPLEFAWVITREPHPSDIHIEAGLNAFRSQGINLEEFEPMPHKNCTYDPPDVIPCNAVV